MKILINVAAFSDLSESKAIQQNDLLQALQNEYCGSVTDSCAYLVIEWCDENNFTFGADDPSKILQVAEKWNDNITARLHRAVVVFQQTNSEPALYDLKKAVMAADDDFYLFADEAVLIPEGEEGECWLHPLLHEDQHDQIKAHPEWFALVEVAAK